MWKIEQYRIVETNENGKTTVSKNDNQINKIHENTGKERLGYKIIQNRENYKNNKIRTIKYQVKSHRDRK